MLPGWQRGGQTARHWLAFALQILRGIGLVMAQN
jgi:hypothetical protein